MKKNIYEFLHVITKQLKISRTDICFFVEDTVFCEVNITTCYSCTRTAKFAHMNGHWKAYDYCMVIIIILLLTKPTTV